MCLYLCCLWIFFFFWSRTIGESIHTYTYYFRSIDISLYTLLFTLSYSITRSITRLHISAAFCLSFCFLVLSRRTRVYIYMRTHTYIYLLPSLWLHSRLHSLYVNKRAYLSPHAFAKLRTSSVIRIYFTFSPTHFPMHLSDFYFFVIVFRSSCDTAVSLFSLFAFVCVLYFFNFFFLLSVRFGF